MGAGDRPLVRNAGSERQVRRATRRVKEREDRLLENLRIVMTSSAGRALMFELLREARVNASVWNDHGSKMAYNVGQQDFGHMMLAKIIESDEGLYELMEREGRAWLRKEDAASDAATRGDENEGERSNDS